MESQIFIVSLVTLGNGSWILCVVVLYWLYRQMADAEQNVILDSITEGIFTVDLDWCV